jgi:hypothetical protein
MYYIFRMNTGTAGMKYWRIPSVLPDKKIISKIIKRGENSM